MEFTVISRGRYTVKVRLAQIKNNGEVTCVVLSCVDRWSDRARTCRSQPDVVPSRHGRKPTNNAISAFNNDESGLASSSLQYVSSSKVEFLHVRASAPRRGPGQRYGYWSVAAVCRRQWMHASCGHLAGRWQQWTSDQWETSPATATAATAAAPLLGTTRYSCHVCGCHWQHACMLQASVPINVRSIICSEPPHCQCDMRSITCAQKQI